jgi:hypothetical protein
MTRPKGSKNKKTILEEQQGRTCNVCDETKPRTDFYPNGRYLMRTCKACDNQRRMRREKKNKKIQNK